MTTLRRLLPIAVLSLSACLVSTNDLKPRTNEECAAQDPNTKACGYKCVSREDPATGCAASGCTPCSVVGLANAVPACDAYGSCSFTCVAGYGDCNGGSDGCETFIAGTDAANCGACGRACPNGGACTNGACAPLLSLDARPSVPLGMLNRQGTLYFVQDDPDPNHRALREVVSGKEVATGLGHVRWLAGDPTAARVWATGTRPSVTAPYGFEHELTAIDVSSVPSLAVNRYDALHPLSSSEYLDGIAVTSKGEVLFTSSLDSNLFVFEELPSATTSYIQLSAASGSPKGIARYPAGVSDYYLFGYSDSGGTLGFVADSPPLGGEQLALRGAGTPSRLAVWVNPGNTSDVLVFWASEDDGSVRWAPWANWASWGYVAPPTGPTSVMDITADADGVYWSNRSTGLVTMWKAATGQVVILARSSSPFGIATFSSWVYWSDDYDQAIYWTTKRY